jgi:hypothetical protein
MARCQSCHGRGSYPFCYSGYETLGPLRGRRAMRQVELPCPECKGLGERPKADRYQTGLEPERPPTHAGSAANGDSYTDDKSGVS